VFDWLVVLLLIYRPSYVLCFILQTTSRIDQDIEFMAQICEQFPASNQMRACTHVMAFLQKLSLRNEQGQFNFGQTFFCNTITLILLSIMP